MSLLNPIAIGNASVDSDSDGIFDERDNCPFTYNPDQEDSDLACAIGCDSLPDRIGDACDNCPDIFNPDQKDFNNDGEGDLCEVEVNPPTVDIILFPRFPGSRDIVNFNITAADRDGILAIILSVNNEDVIKCDSSPCNYTGGPYPDGLVFHSVVADNLGNVVQTDPEVAGEVKDTDGDGVADFLDTCPDVFNPDQVMIDADHDGVDDVCDNCLNNYNPDQNDWDNDGEGDDCDCNDNYKGYDETGADCGGICPDLCPPCVPVVMNGNPDDKIDIVFVKDADYSTSWQSFMNAITNLVQNGMFKSTLFNNNRCKFNFYWVMANADYTPKCSKFDVSKALWNQCPFADSVVIVFDEPGGACSSPNNIFSAPSQRPDTIVHEAGHQHFGLADEYCCGGSYWQEDPHPNVFETLENCQALSQNPSTCRYLCNPVECWPSGQEITNCINWYNSKSGPGQDYKCSCQAFAQKNGLDPAMCTAMNPNMCDDFWKTWWSDHGVTDLSKLIIQSPTLCKVGDNFENCCPNGWWRSDTPLDYMDHGNQFDPDCTARINYVFDKLPSCINPGSTVEPGKVFIINFHIDANNVIIINSATIISGYAPNYLNDSGFFNIVLKSSMKQELKNIFIDNPKELQAPFMPTNDYDESVIYKQDNTNFTMVLPFLDSMRYVEFRYSENGSLVADFDLAETILDFCKNINYKDTQCQTLDLDNDTVIDMNDMCPNTQLPESITGDDLKKKHYADVDGDAIFETKDKRHQVVDSEYTLTDTRGCSCEQILDLRAEHDNHDDREGDECKEHKNKQGDEEEKHDCDDKDHDDRHDRESDKGCSKGIMKHFIAQKGP